MKFEIKIDNEHNIFLRHEDNLVIVSKYMSRVLDIIEDIVKNEGVATLIKYPYTLNNSSYTNDKKPPEGEK